MSEWSGMDLSKPEAEEPEEQRKGGALLGVLLLILVTLLGLVAMGIWAERSKKPARVVRQLPAVEQQYTVAELCNGAAVVEIKQLDISPEDKNVPRDQLNTYVLVQPVGTEYVISCHQPGDYRDYLRVGQRVRLSMFAG